jgi:hypothetical protein
MVALKERKIQHKKQQTLMKTMKWKKPSKHFILKRITEKDLIGMQFVGLFIM